MRRTSIRNYKKEYQLFWHRSIAALIFIGIFLLIIIARLFYLQIIRYDFYSTLSKQNILNIMPITPNRGLIFDRNGVLLAQNLPIFSLNVIPARIKNLNGTLQALGKIINITPDDIKDFQRARAQFRPFQPVPLKVKLTEDEVARFYVDQFHFPGVFIEPIMLRYYPLGAATSNVVGYVGRINAQELSRIDHDNYLPSDYIGKVGIEKYYEKLLHGQMGAAEAEINANNKIIRILKSNPPHAGSNIYLTIDSRLQIYIQKLMQAASVSGAVVAVKPDTGEVLALVTNPSYDANIFVNGIDKTTYDDLVNSPLHPLYNRAIRGVYSPASTIKPFFALLGLNSGAVTPQFKVSDPGWFQLPDSSHQYRDWTKGGHGIVNLARAITVSCDIYFYNLATLVGINQMDSFLSLFNFGQLTGIDIGEEVPGIVPSPQWKRKVQHQPWYRGDTVITGIGQGSLLATPLQIAVAVATLAEHGIRYKPHLLLKSISPEGDETNTPATATQAVTLKDSKTWDTVIDAMTQVIKSPEGTASQFGKDAPFTAAAKTGTAQLFGRRDEEESNENLPYNLRNHHLFIVFAPVDNPQIALAIVIEHSSNADRMARQILDYYFHLNKQANVTNETGPGQRQLHTIETKDPALQLGASAH